MSINARPEFFQAQKNYALAKTREEKIAALEEMLSTAPSHKGAEVMRAEIKSKISKLRKQTEKRAKGRITNIPKEGDAQICILGLTMSGKSTLLSKMTNAKPHITGRPFTTIKPEIGVCDWEGVKFQIIEIPATFDRHHMSIAQNSDGIIMVIDAEKADEQRVEMLQIMARYRIGKPSIEVLMKDGKLDVKDVSRRMWEKLNMIRVYTKEPGKKPETKALVLRKGSNVGDAAEKVHKDFVKFFKFARVWGKSAKHDGQAVGKDHVLKDNDTIEIHTV